MKRVLITGATSDIGRHLISKMDKSEYLVTAVIRHNSQRKDCLLRYPNIEEIIELDMSEYDKLSTMYSKGFFDIIFAFAWEGTRGLARDNEKLQYQNYKYNIQLLECARLLGVKSFFTAGSQAEYGVLEGIITENRKEHPATEYGKWKLNFYNYAADYGEKFNIDIIEPRFFSLYAEDDYEGTMINSTLDRLIKGEPCLLTECTQKWDFLHMDDAADLLIKMCDMECDPGVYNFASGDTRELKNYIYEMRDILGSKSDLLFGVIPYPQGGPVGFEPDVTKVKTMFSWVPRITFAMGVEKIVLRKTGKDK